MAAPTRTVPAQLDVVTSATAADLIATLLDDAADRLAADADGAGQGRAAQMHLRALRRHSVQVRGLHDTTGES